MEHPEGIPELQMTTPSRRAELFEVESGMAASEPRLPSNQLVVRARARKEETKASGLAKVQEDSGHEL